VQPIEDHRQGDARNVEQDGVGEHAIEAGGRQGHSQHVPLPDLAARHGACHGHELRAGVEPDNHMAQVAKSDEITPGPTAEIEDPIWRGPGDRCEQRLDVLPDVMIPGAVAIRSRHGAILPDGSGADLAQTLCEGHLAGWLTRTRMTGLKVTGTSGECALPPPEGSAHLPR
jgi:hypothetical protein